jgi:hypothetical protein
MDRGIPFAIVNLGDVHDGAGGSGLAIAALGALGQIVQVVFKLPVVHALDIGVKTFLVSHRCGGLHLWWLV